MRQPEPLDVRFVRVLRDEILNRACEHVSSYRKLPSRMPANAWQRQLARVWSKLTEEEQNLIARDITDSALFGLMVLLDTDCDGAGIKVSLTEGSEPDWERRFTDIYRSMVDPGGLLIARSS